MSVTSLESWDFKIDILRKLVTLTKFWCNFCDQVLLKVFEAKSYSFQIIGQFPIYSPLIYLKNSINLIITHCKYLQFQEPINKKFTAEIDRKVLFLRNVQMSVTSFESRDFKIDIGVQFSDGVTSFKDGDFKSRKLVTRAKFWCTTEYF